MASLLTLMTRTVYIYSIKATKSESEAIRTALEAEGMGKCLMGTEKFPNSDDELLIEIREVLGGKDPVKFLRDKKLIYDSWICLQNAIPPTAGGRGGTPRQITEKSLEKLLLFFTKGRFYFSCFPMGFSFLCFFLRQKS